MRSQPPRSLVTAEDQVHFDQRWKHLQKIPASIKFISYEPALGALRLPTDGPLPDWVISGGESGGGARPVKRRWIRDVIADCRQHGVAPFHKQWGSYGNNPLPMRSNASNRLSRPKQRPRRTPAQSIPPPHQAAFPTL